MTKKIDPRLLLVLIAIALIFLFKPFQMAIEVFSIDKVDYQSRDPYFNEPAFLVLFKVIGSQELYGTIKKVVSPDEIIDREAGVKAEKGFTFENTYLDQRCSYSIEEDRKIESFYIVTKCIQLDKPLPGFYCGSRCSLLSPWECTNYVAPFKLEDYCISKGGFTIIHPLGLEYWCMGKQMHGYTGLIKERVNEFKARFRLTIEGLPPIERTITNYIEVDERGQPKEQMTFSTFFEYAGEKIAYLKWQGNLQSGRSCPVTEGLVPVSGYTITGFPPEPIPHGWKLISRSLISDYEDWHHEVVKTIDDCNIGLPCDGQKLIKAMNSLNNVISEIEKAEDRLKQRGFQPTSTMDKIIVSIKNPIYYPTYPIFTLHIKAETIGIKQLVAIPKFVERSLSLSAREGETVYAKPHLKNEGETGDIDLYLSCDSGYYWSGKTEVKSGSIVELSIPIALPRDIMTRFTDICRLTARSLGGEDTIDIYINWIPETTCTPGQTRCIGDDLYVCNQYGTGWDFYKHCEFGCDPITQQCRSQPVTTTTTIPGWKPICGNRICEPGETWLNCPDDCLCDPTTHEPCADDEVCRWDIKHLIPRCEKLECPPGYVAKNHRCVPAIPGIDILEECFTCNTAQSDVVRIAEIFGIPLAEFIWLTSLTLGGVVFLASLLFLKRIFIEAKIEPFLIALLLGYATWKLVCMMFWIGLIFGAIIIGAIILLILLFPEYVAAWSARFGRGLAEGLKK